MLNEVEDLKWRAIQAKPKRNKNHEYIMALENYIEKLIALKIITPSYALDDLNSSIVSLKSSVKKLRLKHGLDEPRS